MGRRRALAALAGMATGGLAMAGWELASSGTSAAAAAGPRRVTRPLPPPGTKVWVTPTNAPVSAIAVSGGVVYAGTSQSTVFALDAVTGKRIWRRATPVGINDQVAVSDGAVVVASGADNAVFALGAATGQQLWSHKTNGGILGLAVAGGVIYAGIAVHSGTTGGVTAWTARTGELLWTREFDANLDTNGGLTVAGGVVYVTTDNGEIYAYRTADGTKVWRVTGRNVTFGPSAPVVAGGAVYVCSGGKVPAVYAVDAATRRPLWWRPMGASQNPADLAVAGGAVFAGFTRKGSLPDDETGDLTALDAATGKPRWKDAVPSGVFPAPVIAGGVVYTGSNLGVLEARQAGTGHRLWSYRATDTFADGLAVTGGVVYFGCADAHVYAVAAQR
jgi:outer membrane protein assembly factor BamB